MGATVPLWRANFRIGKGNYFVSEADEYYHNFLNYRPQIIILTMIEMDHPEYFNSLDNVVDAYRKFISNIKPNGVLIYNETIEQFSILNSQFPNNFQKIKYSIRDFPKNLQLQVPGNHNRENAAAIIKLAEYLKIDYELTNHVLTNFSGIGRRLELIGQKRGIYVYDDYANHPTSYSATIQAVNEKYPESRIWAVVEPHTFSRPKATLPDYPQAFKLTHQVIVSKIFASRETDPGDFSGSDIAAATPHATYIPEFPDIAAYLKSHTQPGDIILVMGSGDSYKLAHLILKSI